MEGIVRMCGVGCAMAQCQHYWSAVSAALKEAFLEAYRASGWSALRAAAARALAECGALAASLKPHIANTLGLSDTRSIFISILILFFDLCLAIVTMKITLAVLEFFIKLIILCGSRSRQQIRINNRQRVEERHRR